MSRRARSLRVLVASALLVLLVATGSTATARPPVDAAVDDDADGEFAAVAVVGDSRSGGVAASGVGASTSGSRVPVLGGVAASGVGDSSTRVGVAASGVGDSRAGGGDERVVVTTFAAAGVGNATADAVAVAGVGDARADAAAVAVMGRAAAGILHWGGRAS